MLLVNVVCMSIWCRLFWRGVRHTFDQKRWRQYNERLYGVGWSSAVVVKHPPFGSIILLGNLKMTSNISREIRPSFWSVTPERKWYCLYGSYLLFARLGCSRKWIIAFPPPTRFVSDFLSDVGHNSQRKTDWIFYKPCQLWWGTERRDTNCCNHTVMVLS